MIARLDARFETLTEPVEGANRPTVVASHVSPFSLPLAIRRQHSIKNRTTLDTSS
jgi:hypothetical protein